MCSLKKVIGLDFEIKVCFAIMAVFLLSLVFQQQSISGMQVAPGSQGSQSSCVDTDRGMNPNVMGSVQYTGSRPFSASDTCEGNVLIERVCAPTPDQSAVRYTCPHICSNGACASLTLIEQKPWLSKEASETLLRIARQRAEQERQRAEQQEAQRKHCLDDCDRAYNVCHGGCSIPIVGAACQPHACDNIKAQCVRNCN